MNDDSQSVETVTPEISLPATEVMRLYDAERRLLTLLGNLPGMAYRCCNDPSWTMEFVSPGCRDLTGYAPADLTQGRVAYADLIHPDERERVWNVVQHAVQEHVPFQITYPILTASGETRWVWEQGEAVYAPDGEVQAIEGFITDVTERVQAHEQLEEQVRARTHELTTILEISRSVALMVELDPLFETVFNQISLLIPNESISIGLVEDSTLTIVATRRGEIGSRYPNSVGIPFDVDLNSLVWGQLASGQTVYSPNVRGDDPVAVAYRHRVGSLLSTVYAHVCSWIAAPLVVKGEFIGALFLSSPEEDLYSPHEVELLSATANQVAVAIQNARLHERSRALAVIEERQRLARELHDSVSQALYGIGLGAQTIRRLLEIDPVKAIEPTDYVISLAEAGTAEMRALIFELRPESLETEGLVEALRKQVAATHARYGIEIDLEVLNEPAIALDAKEALYRIAQEALHNTVKHAEASQITLQLVTEAGEVRLTVTDNGRGFDPSGEFPGHLGLQSMRERVARLGGTVEISSAPGAGTQVRAQVPASL